MKALSNEVKGLRGPATRAALAVFTFAALTGWPLLAERQRSDGGQAQVAQAAEQVDSPLHEDTSCRT